MAADKFKVSGVRLNPGGLREVMNSGGVQGFLEKSGNSVRHRTATPDSYQVTAQPGKTRAHCRVSTNSWGAYHREKRDNQLVKALDGGRP